jgi:hypothetical protein
MEKVFMFEAQISDSATVKYATTIKASLSVKFLGFNDKNISKS